MNPKGLETATAQAHLRGASTAGGAGGEDFWVTCNWPFFSVTCRNARLRESVLMCLAFFGPNGMTIRWVQASLPVSSRCIIINRHLTCET